MYTLVIGIVIGIAIIIIICTAIFLAVGCWIGPTRLHYTFGDQSAYMSLLLNVILISFFCSLELESLMYQS